MYIYIYIHVYAYTYLCVNQTLNKLLLRQGRCHRGPGHRDEALRRVVEQAWHMIYDIVVFFNIEQRSTKETNDNYK